LSDWIIVAESPTNGRRHEYVVGQALRGDATPGSVANA
jgi:hypothetical protein